MVPNDLPDDHLPEDDSLEIEVVELVDDNGVKEEFGVLEEIVFEGREFAILVPINELEAAGEAKEESEEKFNIEIFEVRGEQFVALEDEDVAKRLMDYLDQQSEDLASNDD